MKILADTFAASLEETHKTLRTNLQEAQTSETKYAGSKEVVFEVGDKVWCSTRHFWMTKTIKEVGFQPDRTVHSK